MALGESTRFSQASRTAAGIAMAFVALAAVGADSPPGSAKPAIEPPAVAARLHLLPLAGPVAEPGAEISAMFWFEDTLVLVPQFPEGRGDGWQPRFFKLTRQEIAAALADTASRGGPPRLTPQPLSVTAENLRELVPGWDGLEAAVADGRDLFFAVEARTDSAMAGYLLKGRLEGERGARTVILEAKSAVPVPQPVNLPNISQEALVLTGDEVYVLFETYGPNVNPAPAAAVYGRDLKFRRASPCAALDFRVTDATDVDPEGRFWVINYFWPGDADILVPAVPTADAVERLVELRLRDDRIVPSGRPALDLRQDTEAAVRNWEAIVRFAGGFLLMTDRYPTTLLAYVPLPTTLTETGKDRSP